MGKYGIFCFCSVLLLSGLCPAGGYPSEHFLIYSDLDPNYVGYARQAAESYYENLSDRYFPVGWEEPLTIYYSRTAGESRQLLKDHGFQEQAEYGFYIPKVPAAYVHCLDERGESLGWGPLYHELVHHFVRRNFRGAPEWFEEGLACFFGRQGQVGRLGPVITGPEPQVARVLKEKIDRGSRPNVKLLFSTKGRDFYEWPIGRSFAQLFFYWLYERGQLETYLANVRRKGFELSVLEQTVGGSFGKINMELLDFLRANCEAAGCVAEGLAAGDERRKQQAFGDALRARPDYLRARLELARSLYRCGDFGLCRKQLKTILTNPKGGYRRSAAALTGNSYYKQKAYERARSYYLQAWDCAENYPYKYRLAYRIGNCCYYLQDSAEAVKWYSSFLDNNWQQGEMAESMAYARKFIEQQKTAGRPPGRRQVPAGKCQGENTSVHR